MDGDPSNREMVLGYLDSILERDVTRASSMLGGKLPASRFELDERQLTEGVRASRLVALPPTLVLVLEQVTDRATVIADRDRRDAGDDVLKPGLPGLAGQLERPDGLSRSLCIAHGGAEIRKHRKHSHPERVIVETLCELECFAGAPVGVDEPLAEADRW